MNEEIRRAKIGYRTPLQRHFSPSAVTVRVEVANMRCAFITFAIVTATVIYRLETESLDYFPS